MKKLMLGSFFTKSNLKQRESNNKKSEKNQKQNIHVPESDIHETSFLNLYAKYNATIAATRSNVNIPTLNEESIPGNIGETIATPNQNTERLINQSASTDFNMELTPRIIFTLAKIHNHYKNNGQIDDFRIFNFELTPVQVKALMNEGAATRFGPVTGTP